VKVCRSPHQGHKIQTRQLPLEKTESAEVKAFAPQMIKDHTKVNQHLLDLAKQHDFSVPDDAHEQAVRLFDEESRSTSDPDEQNAHRPN
jgi:putative membrane protein